MVQCPRAKNRIPGTGAGLLGRAGFPGETPRAQQLRVQVGLRERGLVPRLRLPGVLGRRRARRGDAEYEDRGRAESGGSCSFQFPCFRPAGRRSWCGTRTDTVVARTPRGKSLRDGRDQRGQLRMVGASVVHPARVHRRPQAGGVAIDTPARPPSTPSRCASRVHPGRVHDGHGRFAAPDRPVATKTHRTPTSRPRSGRAAASPSATGPGRSSSKSANSKPGATVQPTSTGPPVGSAACHRPAGTT